MKTYRVYQVDSFTAEKFKGNPAGVVMNADGLTDQDMLRIARELNNSETAFILSPNGPDHDIRIRYFTPTIEVPICGHATIAAHYVRAVENKMDSTTVMQKIQIGILPVEIIKQNGDYTIIMTQGNIEFSEPILGQQRQTLITALGISKEEMDARCPIQIVSTGHSKVIIGIKSQKILDTLTPNMILLKQLSKELGCNGYFVFTLDSHTSGVLTHGRMFAPAIGISEDPVTGNANGPLGAYLIKHQLVRHDGINFKFRGEQGSAIGRTGIIDVQVDLVAGSPIQVKIGGQAVIVFQTEINL